MTTQEILLADTAAANAALFDAIQLLIAELVVTGHLDGERFAAGLQRASQERGELDSSLLTPQTVAAQRARDRVFSVLSTVSRRTGGRAGQ